MRYGRVLHLSLRGASAADQCELARGESNAYRDGSKQHRP